MFSVEFAYSLKIATEHGKAFIYDGPNDKNENNHDIED